jgi:hypothetical protein
MTTMIRKASAALLTVLSGLACAPRAKPLGGAPVPEVRLPDTRLAAGHRRIIFRWEYTDPSIGARGDGVARIAPPDSVRLDFFLDGGLGGGYAIVLGDSVFSPTGAQALRFLPPPPLLWSTLGRLAVPPAADTAARTEGSILRADIGRDPVWRATFDRDRLVRLERIDGGRVLEWVSRAGDDAVRYENERGQRVLTLKVTKSEGVSELDPTIWLR